ncbi:MAG: CHAT domain-containing protein [Desulfobacterales bacterium]
MEYLNFDLRIIDSRPYQLIGEQARLGEAEGILELDPNEPEIQAALSRLANRQTDREFLRTFGSLLFERLFKGEIGDRYEQCTGFALASKESGLRLRLHIKPPELAALPWELMFTPARNFLGTSHQYPVVRWRYVPKPIQSLQVSMPLRLLVAAPKLSKPFATLGIDQEIDGLKTALSGMGKAVEIEVLQESVTLERLDRVLMEQPCHVLHFIGHAAFLGDRGVLVFNDVRGGMEQVDEDRFAQLLSNHDSLKLIVLNACQGATVSAARAFVGIAPKVVATGVPAVVAMQYPIYDSAAALFAGTFYFALFQGPNAGRIDWAMAQARNALARDYPDGREVATPVLFMRAPEGVLFYKNTGSRWRDSAFSKAERDTEKAVEATHLFNQSLASDPEAKKDPALPDILDQDAGEYEWLKKRIAFRNRLVGLAAVLFVVVFMFFWVGLFDLLRLDSLIEGVTLAAGNAFGERIIDQETVIVAIEDSVNPTWRSRYAELLDRLTEGGARVVAFDMAFSPFRDPSGADAVGPDTLLFAEAIRQAGSRGIGVVLGFKDWKEGAPFIEPELLKALASNSRSRVGAVCLSGKFDYVGVVPLVIQKEKPEPGKDGVTALSLSLAAYMTARQAADLDVKWGDGRIDLSPLRLGSIRFSEERISVGGGCPANAAGDRDADLFIDLSPAGRIREKPHTVSFHTVLTDSDADALRSLFEGKVVFVGEHSDREARKVFDAQNDRRFGVELHADAFRTIGKSASGFPIIRPLPVWGQSLLLITLVLLGAFVRFWVPPGHRLVRTTLLIALPIAYAVLAFAFFLRFRYLADWLYHLAGFGLAYLVSGRIEKRWIR